MGSVPTAVLREVSIAERVTAPETTALGTIVVAVKRPDAVVMIGATVARVKPFWLSVTVAGSLAAKLAPVMVMVWLGIPVVGVTPMVGKPWRTTVNCAAAAL